MSYRASGIPLNLSQSRAEDYLFDAFLDDHTVILKDFSWLFPVQFNFIIIHTKHKKNIMICLNGSMICSNTVLSGHSVIPLSNFLINSESSETKM